MKKIIHLNDLHVGFEDCGERVQCISENIIFERQPAEDYVIVITGDLVERTTDPCNYEETRLFLEKPEDADFTVLVVPGKHDYGTCGCGSKKYVRRFRELFFGDREVEYPEVDFLDGGDLGSQRRATTERNCGVTASTSARVVRRGRLVNASAMLPEIGSSQAASGA